MEKFIRQQNLDLFKKRLAEPHTDAEREMLMRLLTDQQAKEPSRKWNPQAALICIEQPPLRIELHWVAAPLRSSV
jgi:hypothetical protein